MNKDINLSLRETDLATIMIQRRSGKLLGSIKSEALHIYLMQMLDVAVTHRTVSAARKLETVHGSYVFGGAAPGENPFGRELTPLNTYRFVPNAMFIEACGLGTYTDQEQNFFRLRPTRTDEYLLQKNDGVINVSINPLISPGVLHGIEFPINGMISTQSLKIVVSAWKQFLANIHQEYAHDQVIGVTIKTEEFVLAPEMVAVKKELVTA